MCNCLRKNRKNNKKHPWGRRGSASREGSDLTLTMQRLTANPDAQKEKYIRQYGCFGKIIYSALRLMKQNGF